MESSISVPNQHRFQGRKPVIPSSLSDMPCRVLGVAGLLAMLNTILNTSYTLHTARIHSLLGAFITKDSDFGTAYAYLRPFWYRHDFTNVEDELRSHEEWDSKMREDVLVNKRIISEILPPREYSACNLREERKWMASARCKMFWGLYWDDIRSHKR